MLCPVAVGNGQAATIRGVPAATILPVMHRNVRAVVAAAREKGLTIEPHSFPAGTKTAPDAAAAIGVMVNQIVKSLVFLVDGTPVMALVPGDKKLNESLLAAATGGTRVDRPDADAIRAATASPLEGFRRSATPCRCTSTRPCLATTKCGPPPARGRKCSLSRRTSWYERPAERSAHCPLPLVARRLAVTNRRDLIGDPW